MRAAEISGGRITAIEPQKRHPDRVSLFLDGRFAFGLSGETAAIHGLAVGRDLSAEEMEILLAEEETRRARDAAYLLLSYRARSHAEIERRLEQKGFPAALVERITDELAAAGLLDDAAFAESWVRNRQETRPRGKSLLRWELRQKGIAPAAAETALEALQPEDEVAAARAVAERRLERDRDPDPAVRRRRVIGLLQRRGYSWETIREALASLEMLNEALNRGDEPWDET